MPDSKVTPVNVVVVFYFAVRRHRAARARGRCRSNTGARQHSHAAAQGSGGCRDHRVRSRWTENLERMNRDYIAPREIDVDWAEVILVASCPDSLHETEQYVITLLDRPGRNERLLIVPLLDRPGDRLASASEQAHKAVENARKLKT